MKKRYCDFCEKEIPTGNDYYRCCLQKHIDKRQQLIHTGDVCLSCWEQNIKQPNK